MPEPTYFDMGKVLRDVETIKGARTRNKLAGLNLQIGRASCRERV